MKIKSLKLVIIFFLLTFGCQTVKEKSDEIVKKENEKYGKYLGEQSKKLKIELGEPTEDFINEITMYRINIKNHIIFIVIYISSSINFYRIVD